MSDSRSADFSFFEKRRIVITGASGYVAHSLIGLLEDIDCTVVLFSRSNLQPPEKAKARFESVVGDYNQIEDVNRALAGAQTVFHLAAQTSVYRADSNPAQDQTDNLKPLLNLIDAATRNTNRTDFIFSGTVTQVGLPKSYPVSEGVPDRPVTVYDLHKLMGEMYVEYFSRMGTIRGTTLRFPNIYGPGPATSSNDRGVMNLMMRRALAGEALSIYGEGLEVRDYLHVKDLAAALLLVAANMDKANQNHYVLGTEHGTTIAQAINLIADRANLLTGQRPPVVFVQPPAGLSPIEKRSFVANTSKFRNDTGWSPKFSLLNGIDQTLTHMKASS